MTDGVRAARDCAAQRILWLRAVQRKPLHSALVTSAFAEQPLKHGIGVVQCMAHLVHCPERSATPLLARHFPLNRAAADPTPQLVGPLDRSTQACTPKRLLAQKLVELPAACRVLLDALGGAETPREAALSVLLHCCHLNMQLAIQCNKLGLLQRLLKLVNVPGLTDLAKVRHTAAMRSK